MRLKQQKKGWHLQSLLWKCFRVEYDKRISHGWRDHNKLPQTFHIMTPVQKLISTIIQLNWEKRMDTFTISSVV